MWPEAVMLKPNRKQMMTDIPASDNESNAASRPAASSWSRSWSRSWAHAWALAGAVALLLGVFSLYVHPDFMVMLADMVWACF